MPGKWNLFVKRHDGKTHTIVVDEARVQVGSIKVYCFNLRYNSKFSLNANVLKLVLVPCTCIHHLRSLVKQFGLFCCFTIASDLAQCVQICASQCENAMS